MGGSATRTHDLPKASDLEAFVALVRAQGAACRRDGLPWRHIDDPYGVWISEAMLQQTQVSRVLSYWPRWMKRYPSVDALSSASTADVLELWQGLGYNRRALALKKAADICAAEYGGQMPIEDADLQELPGIGPATAAGIRAFAYQLPAVYIETNVRTVFIHHFFPDCASVRDAQIAPLVEATCDASDPRSWYYDLLDYGHALKQQGNTSARSSASYARQSRFGGSHRQKRALIVREVLATPGVHAAEVLDALNDHELAAGRDSVTHDAFEKLLDELSAEGFFKVQGEKLVP